MFTGIVKAIGIIARHDHHILTINSPLFSPTRPVLGASIAVDGVCLTVNHLPDHTHDVGFDLGLETLKVTGLGHKKIGDHVNLEPALCVGDALDGHMVQGHVDAQTTITSIIHNDLGLLMGILIPHLLAQYFVKKGSVTIDGVSLTINEIEGDEAQVCLIPHTLNQTTLGQKKVNDYVHIEVDIIGRYLERFFMTKSPPDRQHSFKEKFI